MTSHPRNDLARQLLAPLTLTLGAVFPATALACASCGCSINADWGTQGLSAIAGWSADLRLDSLNQNQLRSGTGTISPAAAALVNNPTTGGPAEVEQYTRNTYVTTSLDYNSGKDWGVTLNLPYIHRVHSTLGTGSDGASPGDGAYVSDTSSLGDVKLVSRYVGFASKRDWGLQFGLKLPTGSHTRAGTLTDPNGPPGSPAAIDPGLQPGTGTTDVLAGAFAFGNAGDVLSWFAQANYQHALRAVDQYQPGDAESVAAGLRYLGWEGVTPQLQLNLRHAAVDRGAAADQFSTGGTLLYATPGVVIPVAPTTSVYAFLQVPLYQNLRGIQLAPHYVFSVGLHTGF